MEDTAVYETMEATETDLYDLPKAPPKPNRKLPSISSGPEETDKTPRKKKQCHFFSLIIAIFVLLTFLLALLTLTCVISLLANYPPSRSSESSQSLEVLKSLLNKSNEEVLNQANVLQLLVQTLQEQITAYSEQDEAKLQNTLQNYLQQQLNSTSQDQLSQLHGLIQNLAKQLNNSFLDLSKQIISSQSSKQLVKQFADIFRENTLGVKVSSFDMTRPNQQCPAGFKFINRSESPLRTCGRPDGTMGCVSTTFSVYGIEYNYVCGRIVAYQIGTPSGFHGFNDPDIDSDYVAGISLTHGNPREHIWTFANARGEGFTNEVCPCIDGDESPVPQFVGNDYFCDSAIRGTIVTDGVYYPNDPLWDGRGCGDTSTCCEFNSPPWFCKQLNQSTTDDIEMRLCENSLPSIDDSPFEVVELYII